MTLARRSRSASACFAIALTTFSCQGDVTNFDRGDLDAPGGRSGVKDILDVGVELRSFRQHLVEIVLSQDRAQRRLREQVRRRDEVLDLDDGFLRIDRVEVQHCIDFDRDVVSRNQILTRDFHHDGPEIDANDLLHEWNQNDERVPFTCEKRPSVKTTARSYSRKILIAPLATMMTAKATSVGTTKPTSI